MGWGFGKGKWNGSGEGRAYGVDSLLLGREGLADLVRLGQVRQVAVHPVHAAGVAVLFQLLHGFVGMLFFVRE